MIVHGIGVREGRTIAVKAVDEGYFAQREDSACPMIYRRA